MQRIVNLTSSHPHFGVSQPASSGNAAYLAPISRVWSDNLTKYPQALADASQILGYGVKPGTQHLDPQISRIDNVFRGGGTALIAALGSVNPATTSTPLSSWLGGGMWLLSQTLTPTIINAVTQLKTGYNPGQKFISSGNVLRRFDDPGYLPLQLYSDEQRLKWMTRWGIDQNAPNRFALLKDRVGQITQQTYTIWMLAAGFMTPILASTLSDFVEKPVKAVYGKILTMLKFRHLHALPDLAIKLKAENINLSDYATRLEQAAHSVLGHGGDTAPMPQWWNDLGRGVFSPLELDKLPHQLFYDPNPEARVKLAQHLSGLTQNSDRLKKAREALAAFISTHEKGLSILGHAAEESKPVSKETAPNLLGSVDSILAHTASQLEKADLSENSRLFFDGIQDRMLTLKRTLETEKNSAIGTMRYLKHVLSEPTKADEMQRRIHNTTIGFFEELYQKGQVSSIKKLLGGDTPEAVEKTYSWFAQQMRSGQYAVLLNQLGEPVENMLSRVVQENALHRRWQMRYPVAIGLPVLALTLGSLLFLVGRKRSNQVNQGGHE
jgi:hypothetical protein